MSDKRDIASKAISLCIRTPHKSWENREIVIGDTNLISLRLIHDRALIAKSLSGARATMHELHSTVKMLNLKIKLPKDQIYDRTIDIENRQLLPKPLSYPLKAFVRYTSPFPCKDLESCGYKMDLGGTCKKGKCDRRIIINIALIPMRQNPFSLIRQV